jgi:DNA-binding transcriptional ArsR family regulator
MTIELNEQNAELIARRFKVLSDPTRLQVLNQLRLREEASVGEIAEAIEGSQQNVSKHLGALAAGGFVTRRKQGTSSIYRISDPTVLELCEVVSAGIEAQLEQLETALRG